MSLYISVSSGQYLQHLTFKRYKRNYGSFILEGSYRIHFAFCAMISDLKCNHAQNSHIFCTCKCLRDIASSLSKTAFRVSHKLCVVLSEVKQICLEHKGYLCPAPFSSGNCSFPVLSKA